jgi:signal transduction histidine kinase
MNTRRLITILLFLFLTTSLFGVEPQPSPQGGSSSLKGISELLERWFAVESSLYDWQNITANAEAATDGTDSVNSTTENLSSSLDQFYTILENFTGSLIFLQYEGTGLLPQDSGKTACSMTKKLAASVKTIAAMESSDASHSDLLTAKNALAQEADAIRRELYSWSSMDSQVSSNVFSRLIYIFGVFSFFVIGMIILVFILYRDLRHSQIQEQDSSDFSRITMLAQEKERTLISAELHDTVLQDMGRLLQISKDAPSTDRSLSELAQKIMARTREICRVLMPPDFSRLALTDSFVQLCADFEKRASVECRAIIDRDFSADRLSPQMQLQIYRIVQETLSNIEKHSEAKEVTLMARNKEDKSLLICVTDDGKGIEMNSANTQSTQSTQSTQNSQSADGLGIRGMNQRAAILGASLSFVEGAGSGLTVRLEVPLTNNR